MFNPYGAVPQALRGTQATIRNIGQDMNADKQRVADSQLLEAQMGLKESVLKNDLLAKQQDQKFRQDKLGLLGEAEANEQAHRKAVLAQKVRQDPSMKVGEFVSLAAGGNPDLVASLRKQFGEERWNEEYSAKAMATVAGTLMENIKVTPISAASRKTISGYGNTDAIRMLEKSGKILEPGQDVYATLTPKQAELLNSTTMLAYDIFTKGNGKINEHDSWKKAKKIKEEESGDKLLNNYQGMDATQKLAFVAEMKAKAPVMYSLFKESAARYEKGEYDRKAAGRLRASTAAYRENQAGAKVTPAAKKKDLTEGIKEPVADTREKVVTPKAEAKTPLSIKDKKELNKIATELKKENPDKTDEELKKMAKEKWDEEKKVYRERFQKKALTAISQVGGKLRSTPSKKTYFK